MSSGGVPYFERFSSRSHYSIIFLALMYYFLYVLLLGGYFDNSINDIEYTFYITGLLKLHTYILV